MHGMTVRIALKAYILQILLLVAALLHLCFGASRDSRCHCLNTSSPFDRSCQNGCEPGWYGPCCQIGNLAFQKPSNQSSTYERYTAELAVNGAMPSYNDSTEGNCSHTGESTYAPLWWYVILSETENFVIRNITIVNRQGVNSKHLRLFHILYTSEATSSPDMITWNECFYQGESQEQITATYTCKGGFVVGRRVAIYLDSAKTKEKKEKLALCEVYVDGYPASDTADFSSISVYEPAKCDSITVKLKKLAVRWFPEMSCVAFYANESGGKLRVVVTNATSEENYYEAHYTVAPSTTYVVWAATLLCSPRPHNCIELSSDEIDRSCKVGTTSAIIPITTKQLQYKLTRKGTSLLVTRHPKECDRPKNITVRCTDNFHNQSTKLLYVEDGTFCCLNDTAEYFCSVEAYVTFDKVERTTQSVKIERDDDNGESTKASKSNGTAAWVSVLVITIISAAIVASILVLRKYKWNKQRNETLSVNSRQKQVMHVDSGIMEDVGDPIYGNTVGMNIDDFERYCSNTEAISNAFSDIRALQSHSSQAGLDNGQKNRFQNILPYDYNRVILKSGTKDYINASKIHSFTGKVNYIASQGPTGKTIDDFWRMIWQENVCAVVMLTDYVEQCKRKCERYFPLQSNDGSGFTVAIKSESTYDTHTISILSVQLEQEIRLIYHYHFLAWPDQSVPEHSGHWLLFQVKVREFIAAQKRNKCTVVVHCSAGVGRTGAFIAMDCELDRFIAEKSVDVSSCVANLRNQRTNMVQTKEQYMFIHQVLLYGMKTLHFLRPSVGTYQYGSASSAEIEKCINEEWKILQMISNKLPQDTTSVTARLPENLHKNRDPEIVPSDSKRPLLAAHGGDHSGYINAVFCNGCYVNASFIATQWPLQETLSEFWELVYQTNPGYILVLHRSPSTEDYPEIFPAPGGTFSAGELTVTTLGCQTPTIDCGHEYNVSLRLQKNIMVTTESSSVRVIEMTLFDVSREVPRDLQHTSETIMQLQTACKESKERPIIVVCKDGATYCGVFLAAVNSLHRLSETGQVQIFHTVDLLRASQAQFIRSLDQYRYLHQLVSFHANTKRASQQRL